MIAEKIGSLARDIIAAFAQIIAEDSFDERNIRPPRPLDRIDQHRHELHELGCAVVEMREDQIVELADRISKLIIVG